MNSASVATFVASQLATDPKDSKKFLAMFIGMVCMLFIFIVSAVMFFVKPDLAGQIVTLATMAITADGGLIGVYVTGQAAVEFKANSVLQATQDSKNATAKEIKEEGKPDCPPTKPWKPVATDK